MTERPQATDHGLRGALAATGATITESAAGDVSWTFSLTRHPPSREQLGCNATQPLGTTDFPSVTLNSSCLTTTCYT